MINSSASILFKLLRIALGNESDFSLPNVINWSDVMQLAAEQGVMAIAADGLRRIYDFSLEFRDENLEQLNPSLPEDLHYSWLGQVVICEQEYYRRLWVERKVLDIWHEEGIDAMVLKGSSYAKFYPVPEHRSSCDIDLMPLTDWKRSNQLLTKAGYKVNDREKKHSHIDVDGVHVENHQYVCGTKGNKEGKRFDTCLKGLLQEGKTNEFHILFYLKHAQGHFLIEDGIQLKHILDWVLLRKFRTNEVDALIQTFRLTKMADAIDRAASYIMGECSELDETSWILMNDILTSKMVHHIGKSYFHRHVNMLQTMWNRRKLFEKFSDISAQKQMWIYLWGYMTE